MSDFARGESRVRSTRLTSRAKPGRATVQHAYETNPPLAQTRALGNQAVQRSAQSCSARLPGPSACHACPAPVQAKLTVGEPDDTYEQEADRAADAVMRMPEPCVQRRVEPETEEPIPARQSGEGAVQTAPCPAAQMQSLRCRGQALAPTVMRQHQSEPQIPALSTPSIRLDFYPGKPIDAAEVLLGIFAQRREKAGKTLAFAVESLDDIFLTLDLAAQEIRKVTRKKSIPPFVSELHILGHGNPGEFGIGSYMYGVEYLKGLKAGRVQEYMKSGATIYLEGCSAAAGAKGKEFMYHLGRVFFGKETGYIWGNTCPILGAVLEVTTCKPVTYKYPDDFKGIGS